MKLQMDRLFWMLPKMLDIYIPTLCHKKGFPHYSSCMVCMVKDNRTGNFIPSCSALVQDGMDIDTVIGRGYYPSGRKLLNCFFQNTGPNVKLLAELFVLPAIISL